MKRAIVVLITLIILPICNGEDLPKQDRLTPTYQNIEEFGSQIFEYLKADKFDKILELSPDLNDFTSMINNSSFPDGQKNEIINKADYQLNSNSESLKKSYDLFKSNSSSAGIDWSNYSIDYIDFKHQKRDNIEDADIYLVVSFKDVIHKIGLHDCFKSEGTWLIGNEIYWKAQ